MPGGAKASWYYGWDEENAWRTCQGPNAGPTQANSPVDLSYNAQGRMSSYADSDTSTTASYTYDAAGRRTTGMCRASCYSAQLDSRDHYQDFALKSK